MPSVTCPACFEDFEVASPALAELPCDVDYDCEICCRPMRIYFELVADFDNDLEDDDEATESIVASAYGLGDFGPHG